MDVCTKEKRAGETPEFSLFSGSIKCSECDGSFVFIGDETTARELVIRWGFKYQRGEDAERYKLRCEVKEKAEALPEANTTVVDGKPAKKKAAKKKAAPKKKAAKKTAAKKKSE